MFPGQSLTPAEEVSFYSRFPHRDATAGTSVRRAPLPEAPDIGLVGNARLDVSPQYLIISLIDPTVTNSDP